MEPPEPKLNKEKFLAVIEAWTNQHYIGTGEEGYVCRECGSRIMRATCYVSIHTNLFPNTCAGSGKVWRAAIPFCPQCEGAPKNSSTCMHTDESANNASILFLH